METCLSVDKAVEIGNTIKSVLSADIARSVHEPCFNGNELKYVSDCIQTGWVSSVGQYVDTFEARLAEYTGARFAVVTVNGTAALHIAYRLAGVQSQDEVLMPALTFVATANALIYCDAHPHFIDVSEAFPTICPRQLNDYLKTIAVIKNKVCYNQKTGRVIRALCAVHVLGHPADLEALKEICDRYHLALVEDSTEALGSFYKGKHVGHHGLVGTLSFNGNKIITTGGGGAILTNDPEIGKLAKHITTTAKQAHPWKYIHNQVGYNYRLPNINAALGCAQLEQLPFFLQKKRKLFDQYAAGFEKISGVQLLKEPSYANSNYWIHALILENTSIEFRDHLIDVLYQNKIGVRPIWELLHQLPMYQSCEKMSLVNSLTWVNKTLQIPSSVMRGSDHV